MAATEAIRDKKQLKVLANYFIGRGQLRNYAMVVVDACTTLRISDLLRLRWSDVLWWRAASLSRARYIDREKGPHAQQADDSGFNAIFSTSPRGVHLRKQPKEQSCNLPRASMADYLCGGDCRQYCGQNRLSQPAENLEDTMTGRRYGHFQPQPLWGNTSLSWNWIERPWQSVAMYGSLLKRPIYCFY